MAQSQHKKVVPPRLGREVILTAYAGLGNSPLFRQILKLYVPPGSVVADVTFGDGAFWREVPPVYQVKATDIQGGVDFRDLPYDDESIDALVLDPPYQSGGGGGLGVSESYHTQKMGHEGIIELYGMGIVEAKRVLRQKGVLIVKCQDEVASRRQQWTHLELMILLDEELGFQCLDLFVFMQMRLPMMRHTTQVHARKNHSYFLVAEKRG
jgi:hypothetical protein